MGHQIQAFEILSLNYASENGRLVFVFEFSHYVDASSLFYSGTDLDNIIVLYDKEEKLFPEVYVEGNILKVVKPKDLLTISVILGESIRDTRGKSLGETKRFETK